MDLFTKTIFFWLGLLVLVPWIPPCSRRHLVRLMHLQLGMLKNDGVFGPWSVITAQTLETTHTLSIFERMNRTLEKKCSQNFSSWVPSTKFGVKKLGFFRITKLRHAPWDLHTCHRLEISVARAARYVWHAKGEDFSEKGTLPVGGAEKTIGWDDLLQEDRSRWRWISMCGTYAVRIIN